MKEYFCNPVNVNYRYQFNRDPKTDVLSINREAADPTMILFKGRYYIFASMTLGVWVSDDLIHWYNHRLPDTLPLYDYAPDVRIINGYAVFSASRRDKNCSFFRTKDILNGPYEEIPGSFPFWDPNLFQDDDGRVYFYWGCSSETPIYGVELDPETLQPIGELRELVFGDALTRGYERTGEDHCLNPRTEEEIDAMVDGFLTSQGLEVSMLPPDVLPMIRGMFSRKPFVEGAWMDKFRGKYYLQYACPGAEFNTYADAIYVSETPLGPFRLAEGNPYSYHPGGFMPGAGHGSTLKDKCGNLWHASTMRISVHHPFERRVGIWPAGLDADGQLFCNQRYGDWPICVEDGELNPWRAPDWMLLSYGKPVYASSATADHSPEHAVDEDAQTWWQAASAKPGEWLLLDLGEIMDVRSVQINFADGKLDIPVPGAFHTEDTPRYIDDAVLYTRWKLEGSSDNEHFTMLMDKTGADTDLSHDFIILENGHHLRYLRLTVQEVPYGQRPCISGLRVFGRGSGEKPVPPRFTAVRSGELDFEVTMEDDNASGWNILWGESPDKLYHSYLTYQKKQRIGALVKGHQYYVRVDAFNENGISEGDCRPLE